MTTTRIGHSLNFGLWDIVQVPTPEEAWNELLLELKAASEELYVAFVSLSTAPQGNESSPTAVMLETHRYNEALRRLDAARAKVKACRVEIRSSKISARK